MKISTLTHKVLAVVLLDHALYMYVWIYVCFEEWMYVCMHGHIHQQAGKKFREIFEGK